MSEYTSTIRDTFVSRETVVASVTECVKSLSHFTEDPLMSFANVAMQKPLCFTITTQGLCPFEDNVRIIIPYAGMSKAQLLVVQRLIDEGTAQYAFMNCSHQNGDFSVTTVSNRRTIFVDPCLVIFGIFSIIRSAANLHELDAQTILSVMQQHIISTVCLHQHQLQGAWRLMRESEGAAHTAKSSVSIAPPVRHRLAGLRERAVQPAGRDAARVDVQAEHLCLLQRLGAHFRAEGARGREAQRGDLGREHHAEAEALHLVAAQQAVGEGPVVCCGGARNRDAVVEVGVELARFHVHCPVDVHGACEALQELYLTVAVRGVEVRDKFIPHALRVLFRVIEMEFQARHACRQSNYYMFAG